MEHLKHYSSLRDKYAKELNQSLSESSYLSRPSTAPKQVNFDLKHELTLREFRNLRHQHTFELERRATPPHEEEEKVEMKAKKKNKRLKFSQNFALLYKPAIDIFFAQSFSFDHSDDLKKDFQQKINSNPQSHENSFYSARSVASKKSIAEKLQETYTESKKALQESFKIEEKKKEILENFEKYSKNSSFSAKNYQNSEKFSNFYSNPDKNSSFQSNFEENYQNTEKFDVSYHSNKKKINENYSSDIEENIKEISDKSSVDFSLSDQTPFESLKFSQDGRGGFSQYFEKLKKGIFYRLLTPIIQNLAQENSFERESFGDDDFNHKKEEFFKDFEINSARGS